MGQYFENLRVLIMYKMGSVDKAPSKVIIILNEGTPLFLPWECKLLLFFSSYIHRDKSFIKLLFFSTDIRDVLICSIKESLYETSTAIGIAA